MSVNIGNNNNIKNSNIAEKIENNNTGEGTNGKRTFFNRHPVICGFIVSLIAGFILMFSFWSQIISWIEGVF